MKKPITKSASKEATKTTQKVEKLHPLVKIKQILDKYPNLDLKPYGIENF